MKIATILYAGLSGTASVAFSLAEADTKGSEHIFIFVGVENILEEYKEKCKKLNIGFHALKKNAGVDIKYQRQLLHTIGAIKPDVIILHSHTSLFQCMLYRFRNKTKILLVEHQSNELKSRRDWMMSGLALWTAKSVIYLTESYRKQVKKKLGIVFNNARAVVISNGIDMKLFSPAERDTSPDEGLIHIGMLSRLVDIKDHPTLIDAFSELIKHYRAKKNLRLHIAGYGPTLDRLKAQVSQANLSDHVDFSGFLNEQQSAGFLNQLDIYVHATFGETMSTSVMQAMACGNVIIASDVKGINNMVRADETGLLVPLKNSNAMAAAMIKVIENPLLAKQLSARARKFSLENYSAELMFKRYAALF